MLRIKKNITLFPFIFLTCLNSISQTIPSYLPQDGLVGWWPFEGTANDYSGFNNHGIIDGPTFTADRFGQINQAISFDGLNDYVEIQNSSVFNVSQGTVAFWISTTNSSNLMVPLKKTNFIDNSGEQFHFYINILLGNGIAFQTKYNADCQSGQGMGAGNTYYNNFANGNWHLLVGTFDSVQKLYVDGVLVADELISGNLSDVCNGDLQFGRNTAASPFWFQGMLDDVVIWNRVLSHCEINDLFNSQLNSGLGISAGIDLEVCQGDSIYFQASGGGSYQWNNGVINNSYFPVESSDTFIVSGVNSQGCIGVDSMFVAVIPRPFVDAGLDTILCEGEEITLSAIGSSNFIWDNNVVNGVSFIPTQTSTYSVFVSDENGCTNSDSVQVFVNLHTDSILNIITNEPYTINGVTYSQSGMYSQQIQNSSGCDSTIVVNLTISSNDIKELFKDKSNIIEFNDLLGRRVDYKTGIPLIIVFNNGRRERYFLME